MPHHVTFTGVQ